MGKPKTDKPKTKSPNNEVTLKKKPKEMKKKVKPDLDKKVETVENLVEGSDRNDKLKEKAEKREAYKINFRSALLENFAKMIKKKTVKLSKEDLEILGKMKHLPLYSNKFKNVVLHCKVDEEKVPDFMKVFESTIAEIGTLPRIRRRKSRKSKNKDGNTKDSPSKDASHNSETASAGEETKKQDKKKRKRPAKKNKKPEVESPSKTASTKERVEAVKEQKSPKNFGKGKKRTNPKKPTPKKAN